MKTFRHLKSISLAILACGIFFFPSTSMATSVLGGNLIVQQDGNVTATFQGSSAGYISSLYLGDTKIFTTTQAAGTTFNLGNFTAGTVLNFRLAVHNTGHSFYTGAGSNNIDGIAHALVNDSFGENETLVSFEDLLGGGDRDYNDLIFSFSNTEANDPTNTDNNKLVENPEPSTIILLGSGLMGMAAWRMRKKNM